jgi:hypothetical protein
LKIKTKLLYIKIIFSGWVIVPHFGGMTVRGQAVILKFNFFKSCDYKKKKLLGHSIRNSNVHPVQSAEALGPVYPLSWTQVSSDSINCWPVLRGKTNVGKCIALVVWLPIAMFFLIVCGRAKILFLNYPNNNNIQSAVSAVSAYWCLFVCFNASRRDAYPIYFLDPLPDCIVGTECYMSVDVHRPRVSCWVWIRTIIWGPI